MIRYHLCVKPPASKGGDTVGSPKEQLERIFSGQARAADRSTEFPRRGNTLFSPSLIRTAGGASSVLLAAELDEIPQVLAGVNDVLPERVGGFFHVPALRQVEQ